ncbi:MAG TPA: hypothetical protein VEI04_07970 [Syntrophobacteria bacterium]|nr:hypothetical protein [Syntrophobacteria bacterium]
MVALSWIALVVVVSLPVMLVLEIAICLWRNGEAVEIDLHDVDGLFLGVPGEDVDPGEMQKDGCC